MLLFISKFILLIASLKYELNFLDFSNWTLKFEKIALVIIFCDFKFRQNSEVFRS